MRLTRRSGLAALGGALAMPWVRPSWAQGGRVNIYNWADYIGETTLADFTAETGIEATYDAYASAEEMQAKMLAGRSGYDAVVQAGMDMPRMVAAGIYAPLDRARLPLWKNLDPSVLAILAAWDPGNAHAMPYMWGSTGFTLNLGMVRERLPDADIESLDLVFRPENAARLADCGISILDSPTDIFFMVLPWLGIDPDTTDLANYDKVVEAFRAIRPHIAAFDNSSYLAALPNGELCVANSWSGDHATAAATAAEAGIAIELAYVVPRSGGPAWFDNFCIPADAPNPDNAHAFLNYLLRPEVIAACTNATSYANANAAAAPFVDPAIFGDPAIYPGPETRARLRAPRPLSEEQERAINRAWQTIKSGG